MDKGMESALCEAGTAVYFPGGGAAEFIGIGNVIEECLEAFFSACCEDVRYTQSQEYFADFAENNELEFYENGICIRHR